MQEHLTFQDDLRLAQLTELTGLSALVIRAWERRYGFPSPIRTAGGHRRYSREQAEILLRASLFVRSGFRAREAIARARESTLEVAQPETIELTAPALAKLLVLGDTARALGHLRTLESVLGFEVALVDNVLPALRYVGEAWARDEFSVAQEHTATGLVISWLGSVRAARRSDTPGAPLVLLATPPGEHHAVSVWALELMLQARGMNALALGSDVPIDALAAEVRDRRPAALVLGIARKEGIPMLARVVEGLAGIEPRPRIFVGGAGVVGKLPDGVEDLPPNYILGSDLVAKELLES